MTSGECAFCDIVAGEAPAEFVFKGPYAVVIKPLLPVVEGHLLVVSARHVADFSASPVVAAMTMETAAEVAQDLEGDYNLITSRGPSATQSIYHLHLHLVPRRENDGLALPWYSGRSKKARGLKVEPPGLENSQARQQWLDAFLQAKRVAESQ